MPRNKSEQHPHRKELLALADACERYPARVARGLDQRDVYIAWQNLDRATRRDLKARFGQDPSSDIRFAAYAAHIRKHYAA